MIRNHQRLGYFIKISSIQRDDVLFKRDRLYVDFYNILIDMLRDENKSNFRSNARPSKNHEYEQLFCFILSYQNICF
jgi:hypothetical protein